MKRLLLALALACSAAFAAADTKPSEASIKELLTLTDVSKMLDGMWGQIDGAMKGMIAQNTQGQQLNAAQQAAIAEFQSKYLALMREELSWAKMETLFVRVYQNSLNQEEVDGMIAFYKTPTGQAVVKKMPVLMQQVMTEMPTMVGPLMQKVQPLAQQLDADLKAAAGNTAPGAQP